MQSREKSPTRGRSATRIADVRTDDRNGRDHGRSFRSIGRLGLVTTLAVLFLITVGGVVRASESGLGCPDWPTCHGQIIPPLVLQSILEYTHRFVAGIVSVLVVIFAANAWLRYRSQPWLLVPVSIAVTLLVGEIGLGALVVAHDLTPILVTIHLGTAQALFATVICGTAVTYTVLARERKPRVDWYARLAVATVVLTYVLLLIGSFVTMSSAASACASWPLCGNGLQLPLGEPATLNIVHRLVAATVSIGVIAMVARVGVARPTENVLKIQIWAGLGLLILQVAVGAGLVLWRIPPFTAVVHLAIATVFFGNLVAAAFLACFPRNASEATASHECRDGFGSPGDVPIGP